VSELAPPSSFDALMPPAMARRAEEVGVVKATMPVARMFTLAVLAGAFIALGAMFATVASTSGATSMSYGVSRLLAGVVFSLGLVLVVVGGAELFTGNNLIVMAWASRRVTTRSVVRNWVVVYVGNLAGAMVVAFLVDRSGTLAASDGAVRARAVEIAAAKTNLGFEQAVVRGVLANVLVCLAVWLCFSARSLVDKVAAIVLPISAFVAAGFEHSVANMYFVPVGLLAAGQPAPAGLTWVRFLTRNLAPVTLGNLIGGAVLVGLVYWSAYLRHAEPQGSAPLGEPGTGDRSGPMGPQLGAFGSGRDGPTG
jgi:formate/nitrite transporter